MKKKFIKDYWFVIIILVLCVVKQLIAASLPIFARDAGGPDQYKLLIDAEKLYSGTYMQNNVYNIFSLFKRAISFPLFLAVCHALGISYLSGYTLLYTVSCLLALYALMQLCKNRVLLAIAFAIILFCPFSYDTIVQMMYNLSFTAPLAISAISCLFIAYIKRDRGKWAFLGWTFTASVNLALIWLNREDSVWIVPLMIIFLIIIAIASRGESRKKIAINLVISIVPIIIVLLSDVGLAYTNYRIYGIYTTNDYTSTNFEKAYNSILKVEQDYYPEKCSITRGTLEKIFAVSPAMNEMKPYFDKFYEVNAYDQNIAANDGEIEDSLMNIALRDAASQCGYYESAVKANAYWGRVSDEIENAFSEGKLNSRRMTFFGSTLHHPWRSGDGYVKKWVSAAVELVFDDMKHAYAHPLLTYNYVDRKVVNRYEAMTMNYTVDAPRFNVLLAGWLYFTDGSTNYSLDLVDGQGMIINKLELCESPDIAKTGISNTDNCRFSIEVELDEDKEIFIRVNEENGSYQDIPLINDMTYDSIAYHFDVIQKDIVSDADEDYAVNRIKIADSIANCYRFIGCVIFPLFIIGYIYITYQLCITIKTKEYRYLDEWIFQSAILGSILIFTVAISFIHAFMWGALFYTHTMGVLMDFAGITAIVIDGSIILSKIKDRK